MTPAQARILAEAKRRREQREREQGAQPGAPPSFASTRAIIDKPEVPMSQAAASARLREMGIDPQAVLDDFRGTPRRDSSGNLMPTWRDRRAGPAPFDPLAPKDAPKPTPKLRPLWEEPEYRLNVEEALDSDLDKQLRNTFDKRIGGIPDPTRASIEEQRQRAQTFDRDRPTNPSDRYALKGEVFDQARSAINGVLDSDIADDLMAPLQANENARTIAAAPVNVGQGIGRGVEAFSNNVLGVGTDALNAGLNLADPKREQFERPRTGLFDENPLLDPGGALNTESGIIPQAVGQYLGGRMALGNMMPGGGAAGDVAKWAISSTAVTPADAAKLADLAPKGTPLGDFVSPLQSVPGESTLSGMMKGLGESMLTDALAAGLVSGGDAAYRAARAKPAQATNAGVPAPRIRAPNPDLSPLAAQDIRSIMARNGAEVPSAVPDPRIGAPPRGSDLPPDQRPSGSRPIPGAWAVADDGSMLPNAEAPAGGSIIDDVDDPLAQESAQAATQAPPAARRAAPEPDEARGRTLSGGAVGAALGGGAAALASGGDPSATVLGATTGGAGGASVGGRARATGPRGPQDTREILSNLVRSAKIPRDQVDAFVNAAMSGYDAFKAAGGANAGRYSLGRYIDKNIAEIVSGSGLRISDTAQRDIRQAVRGRGRVAHGDGGPGDQSRAVMSEEIGKLRTSQKDWAREQIEAPNAFNKTDLYDQKQKLKKTAAEIGSDVYATTLDFAKKVWSGGRAKSLRAEEATIAQEIARLTAAGGGVADEAALSSLNQRLQTVRKQADDQEAVSAANPPAEGELEAMEKLKGYLLRQPFMENIPASLKMRLALDEIPLETRIAEDPVGTAHWLQSKFGESAEAMKGTDRDMARALGEARERLLVEIEAAAPAYGKARADYGDEFRTLRAGEFGKGWFSDTLRPEDVAERAADYSEMTTRQKTLARMSTRDEIMTIFESNPEEAALKLSRLSQEGNLKALEQVFGAPGKRVADTIREIRDEALWLNGDKDLGLQGIDSLAGSNSIPNAQNIKNDAAAIRNGVQKGFTTLGDRASIWGAALADAALMIGSQGMYNTPMMTMGVGGSKASRVILNPSPRKMANATEGIFASPRGSLVDEVDDTVVGNGPPPAPKPKRAKKERAPLPDDMRGLQEAYKASKTKAERKIIGKKMRRLQDAENEAAAGGKEPPEQAGFGGRSKDPAQADIDQLRYLNETDTLDTAAGKVSYQSEVSRRNGVQGQDKKVWLLDGKRVGISTLVSKIKEAHANRATQNGFGGKPRDLPMDDGSRMERAREQGFNTDHKLFHATNSDFDAFDTKKIRTDLQIGEDAIFLTNSPAVADSYLPGAYVQRDAPKIIEKDVRGVDMGDGVGRYYSKGSAVYPVYARNLDDYEIWDMNGGGYDPEFMQRVIKEAKENGAPGVILRGVRDPGIMDNIGPQGNPRKPAAVVVVFDPKDIRSVNAKFDPAESGSSKLLAGMGGKSRGIADNLKQDAALAAFGSVGGSFANQDDPQAGALGGMGLALGGKYGPRLANAMRGAGRVKPPPVRGADQAGIGSGKAESRSIIDEGQGSLVDGDEPSNPTLTKPEPGNKHSIEPAYRAIAKLKKGEVIDKRARPPISKKFTQANSAKQLSNIDQLMARHQTPESSNNAWSRMMADMVGDVDAPLPPYQFIKDMKNGGEGAVEKLKKLTPEQIAEADHGFHQAEEFRQAYISGKMKPTHTTKLFLWSFLSRGVSPYVQESMFMDAFRGADEWIQRAVNGTFDEEALNGYKQWAETVSPKGTGLPGSGTQHNLNAFGESFLTKMSQRAEDGETYLQKVHDMIADQTMTGPEIRRAFSTFPAGIGIDNKVISFTLLASGRKDIMVLDRIQMRSFFNDGRFGARNIYDGEKTKKLVFDKKRQAEVEKSVVVPGTSLAEITYGAHGIVLYEAAERALAKQVDAIYAAVGRPQDASIGRYHWDTWNAASGQEASHGTLGSILKEAQQSNNPLAGVRAKEGEYGAYAYNTEYGFSADGERTFHYTTPQGSTYEFSVPAYREFIEQIKKAKNGVVPSNFKVTDSDNAPWTSRPEVNTDALESLAARYSDRSTGERAGRRSGSGATLQGNGQGEVAGRPERELGSAEQSGAARDGGGRYSSGGLAPLEGAPNVRGATGPDAGIVSVAESFAEANGIPFRRQARYAEVDVDLAGRIAQAYEEMPHAPRDPEVREAYENLKSQTRAQYDALVDAGYRFDFFDAKTDPYKGNPSEAVRDVRANKRMSVYGTYDGYGTEGVTGADIADNPMLEDTGLRWTDQNGVEYPVLANDLFRAVHDVFGHSLEGAGFRARGEENAWQAHMRLYTGSARKAATTETRGQNSWLNYGPYGDTNRTASLEETNFARQKVGLLPEWTWTEGVVEDAVPAPRAAAGQGKTIIDDGPTTLADGEGPWGARPEKRAPEQAGFFGGGNRSIIDDADDSLVGGMSSAVKRAAVGGALGGAAGAFAGEAIPQTPDTEQRMADNKAQLDSLRDDIKKLEADKGFFRDAEITEIQKRLKREGKNLGNTGPNRDGVDGINKGLTQKGIEEFKAQIEKDLEKAYQRRTDLEKVATDLDERSAFEDEEAPEWKKVGRELAQWIGLGAGMSLGYMGRSGAVKKAIPAAQRSANEANALLTPGPVSAGRTNASRAALKRQYANINEFWIAGGAGDQVPFEVKANGDYKARPKKDVMPPSQLFKNHRFRAGDNVVMAMAAGEVGLSTVGIHFVEGEMKAAQQAVDDQATPANVKRLETAKDNLALLQLAQRAGAAMLATRIAGSFKYKYPSVRETIPGVKAKGSKVVGPDVPGADVAGADSERALLLEYLQK